MFEDDVCGLASIRMMVIEKEDAGAHQLLYYTARISSSSETSLESTFWPRISTNYTTLELNTAASKFNGMAVRPHMCLG